MKAVLIIATFFTSNLAFAAFESTAAGSRQTALGGSLVASRQNEWSVFSNPAGLRGIAERTISIAYAPRLFELRELSIGALSYIEPTQAGVFAISATRFGFELYSETRVALSYAEEIASGVRAGASVNYYALRIQSYGSASSVGFDVGLLIDISDDVAWGFSAGNVNAPTIGSAKEMLPQVFSTGFAYSPIREATLSASIVKDVRYTAELHVGVEYAIVEMLALRAGSTTEPNTLNAGVGIQYDFVQLDYAFSSHSELGITHQFSLSLQLGSL